MSSYPTRWVIGIDEAGRGPLAGPVVVGGVAVKIKDKGLGIKDKGLGIQVLEGIRDSKKLSPRRREEWFRILTAHPKIIWAVARVWPKIIDRIHIAAAANLGVLRVYQKLASGGEARVALLDAGLKLPSPIFHRAIIKGDEKIPLIAAASIIAKVTRDRIMVRLHKKYPQYGFDKHKGYGTKAHREMIGQFGRSEIHRVSFRV